MRKIVFGVLLCLVCVGALFAVVAADDEDYLVPGEYVWITLKNRLIRTCNPDADSDECCDIRCPSLEDIANGNVDLGSMFFSISTGRVRREPMFPVGNLQLLADSPSEAIASPQSLTHSLLSARTVSVVPVNEGGSCKAVDVTLAMPAMAIQLTFRVLAGQREGWPGEEGTVSPMGGDYYLQITGDQPWTQDQNGYSFNAAGVDNFVLHMGSMEYLYPPSAGETLEGITDGRGRTVYVADHIEGRYDENGVIRQVKTVQGLTDIVIIDTASYEIRFYRPSQFLDGGQLYEPKNGEAPFAAYRIERRDPVDLDEWRVSKIFGTKTNVYDFAYTAASDEWELTKAGGLRRETRDAIWDDSRQYQLETHRIYDINNSLVKVTSEKVRNFPWGMDIVEETVGEGASRETTSYTYYEFKSETGKYSQVKSVAYPDGRWTRYDYSTNGLKTTEITGWLDARMSDPNAVVKTTEYSYDSHDEDKDSGDTRPRTVTVKVGDAVLSKTLHLYFTDTNGDRVVSEERCVSANASWGDVGNLRTTKRYYGTGSLYPGWLKSVKHPDDRQASYTYDYGTYTEDEDPAQCSFAVDAQGDSLRTTITLGTTTSPSGIANKTTRQTAVVDPEGNEVLEETLVYTGSAYECIGWVVRRYDDAYHPVREYRSNGTVVDRTWGSGCCGKEYEKGADGTVHRYGYDLQNRLVSDTKEGVTTNLNLVTSYTYDASGRRLSTTVTNEASGLGIVMSRNLYDLQGRLTNSVDAVGIESRCLYSGLTSTVIRAGVTNITVRYPDGRIWYTKVNGTCKTTYAYGVDANEDTQVTTTYTGPAGTGSAMWSRTVRDMLGRIVRKVRPGFGGVSLTNAYVYGAVGRLEKTTATGRPDTLYVYDASADLVQTVINVEDFGTINSNGLDRISGTDVGYAKDDGHWWQTSSSYVFADDNSASVTTTSVQRVRLTGLSSNKTSETVAVDIHENETVSKTAVNRDAKRVTQTVDHWDSTNDTESVTINGLVVANTTKTALTYTYQYDALERRTGTTDPRVGTALTHYNAQGQVDWVMDAASNKTWYAYDVATARRIAVTNALGDATYYQHDPEGRLLATWGNVYPVAYGYDEFDRMTKMYTLRDETVTIDDYDDIVANLDSFDDTTWLYDEATGLLTNKVYDDGHGPSYIYTADGRLSKRTWARGVETDYLHDDLGQLTNINHNGSAPNVTFMHDRLGRRTNVVDALGMRTFTYNDSLLLKVETNALGVISRSYDADNGRSIGFSLDDYVVNYTYSTVGRFGSVGWGSYTATYAYVDNSDFVAGYDIPVGANTFGTRKALEPHRHLIATVSNFWNATSVSTFEYQNDTLGRRTACVDNTSITNSFGYNGRNELVSALMDTNTYGYAYDPIGNRLTTTNNAEVLSYLANELNQYTNVADGVTNTPTYDLDGNMLTYGAWTFSWNGENRLVQASNGTTVVTCGYDYMGRRIWKAVGTDTNWFEYDGWAMIRETSGNVTNDYVYGLDLSGSMQGAGTIGGALIADLDGTTVLYSYDANGNVTGLTGTDGATVARYEYDPYGDILLAEDSDSSGTVNDNPFRFSTKYMDGETGLLYYGFRYYSPMLGRWPNRDPIEEAGGLNLYGMVGNSPVDEVDVDGRQRVQSHWEDEGLYDAHTVCMRLARRYAEAYAKELGPDWNCYREDFGGPEHFRVEWTTLQPGRFILFCNQTYEGRETDAGRDDDDDSDGDSGCEICFVNVNVRDVWIPPVEQPTCVMQPYCVNKKTGASGYAPEVRKTMVPQAQGEEQTVTEWDLPGAMSCDKPFDWCEELFSTKSLTRVPDRY